MTTNELKPQTPDVVVALDIGTTKVCCLAGKKSAHGKVEIIGIGKVESVGVLRGVVSNIEKTVSAIREAVEICERQAGMKFRDVHVGIAGQHIKSLQHRGILTRESDHTEINDRDIERLVNDMFKLVLPPGDKIIHVFPQEFTVDNEQGITDPVGMCGVRLEANFHIITGQITAINNIYRCIEKAGLKVKDLTLEPIASADAVLSEEEKQAGVALVDMGGGTTDITIFHEGLIRHTAVIPFGGNVITADIKEGCTVMQPQAEKLKVKFGSALSSEVFDNRIITIPGLKGREHKEISEKNLSRIIQARMEEILDYVLWEIRRSGFERKLIGGIVLTGGGALMNHIEKLTELHTAMSCRIGLPVENLAHGYRQTVSSPIFSTAIGLLQRGLDDVDYREPAADNTAANTNAPLFETANTPTGNTNPVSNAKETTVDENDDKSPSWLENVFRKTKEWFEAEPDIDFNKK
jgi:cell division protein FtsA